MLTSRSRSRTGSASALSTAASSTAPGADEVVAAEARLTNTGLETTGASCCG